MIPDTEPNGPDPAASPPPRGLLVRAFGSGAAVLAEVWGRRLVVGSLWRNETRSRYANSAAGVCWALIAPLALITVYTVVFSAIISPKLPGTIGGFGFFMVSGMLPWLLVSQTAAQAPGSLLAHGPTLRRFALPPTLVPASVVLSAMTDAAIASSIFVVVLALSGHFSPFRLPAAAAAAALTATMVFGLALAVCALNVYGRDVAQAVAAFLPFWFFASPIAYPAEVLPRAARWILAVNPMSGIIDVFRWSLVAGPPPSVAAVAWSVGFALATFLAGAHVFQETRGDFADLL